MKLTTLCYIEKENQVLMLHRIKKKEDANANKWIGVGGKLENDETPKECAIREIKEETGLTVNNLKLRGILTFILPKWENEMSFLYTTDSFEGKVQNCDEGELKWIEKSNILELNLWDGDRVFLKRLLETDDFFSLKLIYDKEDNFIDWVEE